MADNRRPSLSPSTRGGRRLSCHARLSVPIADHLPQAGAVSSGSWWASVSSSYIPIWPYLAPFGVGETMPANPANHTPILAFEFDCPQPTGIGDPTIEENAGQRHPISDRPPQISFTMGNLGASTRQCSVSCFTSRYRGGDPRRRIALSR